MPFACANNANSPVRARLLNHSALTGGVLAAMLLIAAPSPALAQVIDVPDGNTATLAALIVGGSVSKTGGGTLILTGNNTYGAGTNLNAGTIEINNDAGIGTGSLNMANGTTFRTTHANAAIANAIAIGATGTVDNAQAATLNGVISGFTLIKTGAGVLTLTNANTHTFGTIANTGTIEISHNAALGTGTLTLQNGAAFRITHANAAIANDISLVNPGSINNALDAALSGVISGGGGLNKTGGGTLTLTNANTYSGGTQINVGTIAVSHNSALGTGALNMATGTMFRATHANAAIANNIAITGTGTVDNAQAATLSGVISGGALTKTGGGTLTLTNANTYSSGTNLNAGTLEISNNAALGTVALNMATGTTFRTTHANAAIANNIAITGTGTVDNAQAATLSGVISGGALTKTGGGTLTLTNANTYSSGTNLNAGTLEVSSNAALGTGALNMLNGTTFRTTHANAAIANNIAISATGTVDNALATTLNGVISGGGGLNKTGAGTLTLTNANTYSGGTQINAGVLAASHDTALGTGVLAMANGTTLRVAHAGAAIANAIAVTGTSVVDNALAATLSGVISGGALTKTGAGLLTLNGANTFTGGLTLTAGALQVGHNSALGAGAFTMAGASTLQTSSGVSVIANNLVLLGASVINPGADATFSGAISGAGGFAKNGVSTLTLTGANSYTGATTVNAGKLVVNGSIASSASLTIAQGAEIGGNGALPPLIVHGALAPGNSVGVINAAGLTLTATSTTRIEIEGATVDRINVTGATTLDGTLQLVAAATPYVFGSPYTFLTSTTPIAGRFATITTVGTLGVGVTTDVQYGTNAVTVSLTAAPLVTVVQGPATLGTTTGTRNVLAVAAAMDRAVAGGANATPFFSIYNQPSALALSTALNTLTGEIHTAAPAMAWQTSDQFLRGMLDPAAAGRGTPPQNAGSAATGSLLSPMLRFWGAALGQTGRTNGDQTVVGSSNRKINDGHLAFGGDFRLSDFLTLGIAASGGYATSSLRGSQGSAKADVAQVGGYALARFGAVSIGASMAFSTLDVDSSRSIPALGAGAVRANYRVNAWSGRLEAAITAFRSGSLTMTPFAALQVQTSSLPFFIERNSATGAAFGLASRAHSSGTSRTELGMRIDRSIHVAGSNLALYARAGWAHYLERDAQFSGALINLPGAAFRAEGARPSANAALLGFGGETRVNGAVSLGARIDAELSAAQRRFSAKAAVNWAF